jgi:hypothetical protein
MAIAGEGVFNVGSGRAYETFKSGLTPEEREIMQIGNVGLPNDAKTGTVTLEDFPSHLDFNPKSSFDPNDWPPNTTVILNVDCGEYDTKQLAVWDNYEYSKNIPLIKYAPIIFSTDKFKNRCGEERLIDFSNITNEEICKQAAEGNPDQDIVFQCRSPRVLKS